MKKIAVTCDIEQVAHVQKRNFYVNAEYLQFVKRCGCSPYIVAEAMEIDDVVNTMDGLLLTGGRDVNPISYNSDLVQNGSTGSSIQRDAYEKKLYKGFVARGKPVFGICRGFQIIEILNGMRLTQEIHNVPGVGILHNQAAVEIDGDNPVHFAYNKGVLEPIVGLEKVPVNSFHHQGVVLHDPGKFVQKFSEKNMLGYSLSNDKTPVLEAAIFEVDSVIPNVKTLVGGVQYHPERLVRTGKTDIHTRFFRFVMGIMKLENNILVDTNADNVKAV